MNCLIPLKDIIGKDFLIPSYQRGYRWQPEYEVKDLLEDLYEFFTTKVGDENNYYCLQPLVVKLKEGKVRVLDGQQRLTTFYLIYKHLFNKEMFSIEYETRLGSGKFLSAINNISVEAASENIDFYHFHQAFEKIKNWFDDKKREIFQKYFLNRAKVIWYNVSDEEDEVDVFLRLNIGKIPLTNAELIKALFLSKTQGEDRDTLKDRAKVWYDCEIKTRKYNDKAYCLFNNINNEDIYTEDGKSELNDDISRVEMYFSLLSSTKNTLEEPQAIFKHYYELVKKDDKEDLWYDFESCQSSLLAIANPEPTDYNGRRLYHYIGFLIYSDIISLQTLWEDITHMTNASHTIELLKDKIISRFKNINLLDLSYPASNKQMNSLLLLFNLEDLNRDKSNQKDFEFNRFKMQQWSLEHIIPQSLKKETDFASVSLWIKDLNNFLDNKDLRDFTDKIDEKNFSKHLEGLKSRIDSYEDIHTISNLVLLDKASNSSLGNDNFLNKSRKIKELSNTNKLVPQCTGYVFGKKYSSDRNKNENDPTIWTSYDRKKYLEEIQELLKDYLVGDSHE